MSLAGIGTVVFPGANGVRQLTDGEIIREQRIWEKSVEEVRLHKLGESGRVRN